MEIFAEHSLAWTLFAGYLLLTSWLAWLGHKKTEDLSSFALGKGDMNPLVMGVTLATAIASVATFVVNPGFVYAHGLSALLHLGVAAALGMFSALFIVSFGFQRIGKTSHALTLPQWIGQRYESQAMTIFFAAINFLSLTFVVLIVGALSLVMEATLGLSSTAASILIIGFVFSYIFIGGTYAHAYTNTLQGIIMTVIAVIIVASGAPLLAGGIGDVAAQLTAVDPVLVSQFNPSGQLFGGFFSVYVAGFLIGFALVCQPHVIIKALYVEDRRALWKGLGVYLVVSIAFLGILLVGVYAHLVGIGPPAEIAQDEVLILYVIESFPPVMVAIISVALLAAGMSTLDGILIALSSIAANDFFLNLTRHNLLADKGEEERHRIAHRVGQMMLIAMGIATFIITAVAPPDVLAIFGQIGVYGIVATSCVPILFGIFFPHINGRVVFGAALAGLATYVGLFFFGAHAAEEAMALNDMVGSWGVLNLFIDDEMTLLGFPNPAVPAAYAIMVTFIIATPAAFLSRRQSHDDRQP